MTPFHQPANDGGISDSALRCPSCHASDALDLAADAIVCTACSTRYPRDIAYGTAQLISDSSKTAGKLNIQAWWGDLYKQLYAQHETTLDRETLAVMLVELEDMFRARQQLAAVEMPLEALAGKVVLEIGPGGGGHSALFQSKGAEVTAVDITPERVIGAAIKLALAGNGLGRAYQADAENLPFRNDSFDIVYSNGVLHHSEDTARCIAEVFRVLRPGGRAVLMLYARGSAAFWCNIVPRGLISGEMFRWPEAEWIGRVTEGRPKFGETKNPFTRVYSAAELHDLLAGFEIESLRQSSFQFDNFFMPRLTQIRNTVLRLFGRRPHPGGRLVYGVPYMVETPLELCLGRHLGFAWNIVARKP